jgi:hypothetical protein
MALLLQDLGRLLRGQTRHFTEHHDRIVNELWPRLQLLPQGYPQDLFKELLVASGVLVATLVGMNRGKQSPFAVDCRTINTDGYRRLYFTLLAYFAFQLTVINPAIRHIYLFSLALLCGASEDQRALLARLRRAQTLLPRHERKSPGIGGHEVWEAVRQVLKPGERPETDPGGFTAFMIPAGAALNSALQRLKQQSAADELTSQLNPDAEKEIDRLANYIRALLADFDVKEPPHTRSKEKGA